MTEKEVKTGAKTDKGAMAKFGGKRTVVPINKTALPLFPVEVLAKKEGLQPWETAGLAHYAGWAAGKQVTDVQFKLALDGFKERQMGSGKAV